MYRVLICDDDRDIVSALKIYLSAEGYELYEAYTGREALKIVKENPIDLILMDIMMPEMDGIVVTAKLREKTNIPIIFLTAKSESADKILGLNIGADDYITKPFEPLEVLARVRSQLRRYTNFGGKSEQKNRLVIGGIELDDESRIVTVDGEEISLTPMEYNILHLLMKNPGKVFSSAEIYETIWNESSFGSQNSVAVHIRHLREKIEITPSEPRYLKVVWGQGYKITDSKTERRQEK
ncbi:MAG: response regulator transcription factor [Christensenellaceae bacterium]|nr:response regulator transcription factor [Christensenellaceae bacterium]